MEPVRVSPLEGLSQFLSSGFQGPSEQFTDEVGNVTVDTALPSDTHIWETGINRPDVEAIWVIVEQYPDRDAALKGQAHWVKLMTDEPEFPLKDIDNWSLDTIT